MIGIIAQWYERVGGDVDDSGHIVRESLGEYFKMRGIAQRHDVFVGYTPGGNVF